VSPRIEVFPSASKDVLAIASLEVDLSSIESGTTVINVKWCGVYKIVDHAIGILSAFIVLQFMSM
jgi:hypothetical protein